MANELKVLQRQLLSGGSSLPRTSSFANVQSAYADIAKGGAFAAQSLAIEKGRAEGAEDALAVFESAGEKERGSPGFLASKQAYNQAFNAVESKLVATKVSGMLANKRLEMSQDGVLSSQSMAAYEEVGMGIIAGALEGVSEQNKTAVAVDLHAAFMDNSAKLANSVTEFNMAQGREAINEMTQSAMGQYQEARAVQDTEAMERAETSMYENIQNFKTLGFMTEAKALEAEKQAGEFFIQEDAKASYLEARAEGQGEAFLANLGTKPQGWSNDLWHNVISDVYSLHTEQEKLVNAEQSLNKAQWSQKLLTGEVQTLQDLEPARSQMSATSFIGLQNEVLSAIGKQAVQQAKVSGFIQQNTSDPSKAMRASTETKNAAYEEALTAYVAQKRDALGDPNYEPTLLDKSNAVQAFSVPIPAFNDEVSYSLQYGGDMEAYEAALAYQQLAGTPGSGAEPSPVIALNKEAEQIAVATLFRTNFSTIPPEEAIASARDAINNKDDVVRKGRLAAFDQQYAGRSGKISLQRRFKNTFKASADDNPVIYEAFQAEFRENAAQMTNVDEAYEMTKRTMSPLFSRSKYGRDKRELMQYSPEKNVAFIEEGHWFDNQYIIAAQNIAKNYERAGELQKSLPDTKARFLELQDEINAMVISESFDGEAVQPLLEEANRLQRDIQVAQFAPTVNIKIPEGAAFPSSITEQQLMGEKAAKGARSGKHPVLEIDGKKRPVFMMADPTTGNRQTGRLTYGLYYNDDFGTVQPIIDPFSESGFAEFGVIPLDQFLPATMEEMNNKTIDSIAEKEAAALFERGNPFQRMGFADLLPSIALQKARKRAAGKRGAPAIADQLKSNATTGESDV